MGRRRRAERTVTYFRYAGEQFAVLAVPLKPRVLPAALTAAEREVVQLIFEGKSNAAIAKARGVSIRTVANQVASSMRKLRVGSRAGLIAELARSSK